MMGANSLPSRRSPYLEVIGLAGDISGSVKRGMVMLVMWHCPALNDKSLLVSLFLADF